MNDKLMMWVIPCPTQGKGGRVLTNATPPQLTLLPSLDKRKPSPLFCPANITDWLAGDRAKVQYQYLHKESKQIIVC